ncbi:MAG: periplasmic heavy metal sensor [Mesorhizobium sp.]
MADQQSEDLTMMFQVTLWLALVFTAGGAVAAQQQGSVAMAHHSAGSSTTNASPYAGMERRVVKALSDQDIADLKAGRGMGLARAAELNGYPGPSHVLELADALHLSNDQSSRTKALLDAMKTETIPLGERLLGEEIALDRLFADRTVTPALLDAAATRIGAAQGALRAAHLRYHLAMIEVLNPDQIARYAQLRGYAKGTTHEGHSD